ncbi:fungal specific transcription factor [Ophiostoma piceae UAMH 11346]|uniref:Fungal specific transcription factor n=1 Tax=Ophiostoma piceae (strain UAMH 11346) TaxID=1262450 RepID=S3CPV9_OPHP1|nr:fungal specific transcription factor [Ophiostoma piceae UAMH 11346]
MALYISPALPAGTTADDPAVMFFSDFYRTSDNPDAHGVYVDQFTPDASVAMGSIKVEGQAAISAVRKGMWEKVAARHHAVHQIYPFGSGTNEYMLHGVVNYTAKDGSKSGKEWAAHAVLVPGAEGKLKLKLYHVYLDTAPPKA